MTTSRSEIDLEQNQRELDDLCQMLTVLRCRLELSKMVGHEDNVKDAIEESPRRPCGSSRWSHAGGSACCWWSRRPSRSRFDGSAKA